jgi:hypothetical protein
MGIDDLLLIDNCDQIFVMEGHYPEFVRLVKESTCRCRLAAVRKPSEIG